MAERRSATFEEIFVEANSPSLDPKPIAKLIPYREVGSL
jgi:hypothetical protein